MSDDNKIDIKRLKTVKSKALELGLTTMAIYKRIERGEYESIEVDGVKFIVEKPE